MQITITTSFILATLFLNFNPFHQVVATILFNVG